MNDNLTADLDYAAIETNRDIIRMAHDKNGMVYIVSKHHNMFTAPFDMANKFGTLFRIGGNGEIEEYYLNDVEKTWVNGVASFASSLERR